MRQIEILMAMDELLEATNKAEKLVRDILIADKAGELKSIYNDIEYSCCMVRQDMTSLVADLKSRWKQNDC